MNICRLVLLLVVLLAVHRESAAVDTVTEWNMTIHDVMRGVPEKANPGVSTRAIAMMNGAIYDVFQAFDRTHAPFLVRDHATPGASRESAVAQAAHDVLVDCYAEMQTELGALLQSRLGNIAASPAEKAAGTAFDSMVAQQYIAKRLNDHSGDMVQYTGPGGIGHWEPDPLHPDQEAWGPGWGTVHTWAVPSSDYFPVPGPPNLTDTEYTNAYNEVKDWGALNSPSRAANPDTTTVGLFWAYDRAGMGPPPVMFVRSLVEIANQTANSPADNARLFAMASVAMADAAVASWDSKFQHDFWRPIAGIRAGDQDQNPNTLGDVAWVPLGAPGDDPNDPNDPTPGNEDDFTPPFPAYTSGHATMGGALFKSIERFFGTNEFGDVVGIPGAEFTLYSEEAGSGGSRTFSQFAHYGLLAPGLNYSSPDGENGISRVYLGVHWLFDQQDGMDLGHAIANYVADNRFFAVPEPGSLALALVACSIWFSSRQRRASR